MYMIIPHGSVLVLPGEGEHVSYIVLLLNHKLFIYLFIYIPLPFPVWGEKHNTRKDSEREEKKERKEKIQQESIVYFSTDTTLIATKVGRR